MLFSRSHLLSLAALGAALAAACGDTVSTGSAGAAGSAGTAGSAGSATTTSSTGTEPREPKVHRADATECTAERPPGHVDDPSMGGDCMIDSDCTKGDNGRCVQPFGKPTICSYDACAKDADCGGASVCDCRNTSGYSANVCVHGNCLVDADCGAGGYCSPSAVTLDPFCTEGVQIGQIGYFCHSADDECIDDEDCGAPGSLVTCFFNVDKLHFACFQLMCVN